MADLLRPDADAALAEWGRRVRANRDQVDRLREVSDGADFYAPVAPSFRADPHRQDDPVLKVLRMMARPHECWVDIGAGGGRYALPLALQTREVIAVEPSNGMLEVLRSGMEQYGIRNIKIVQGRFPMLGVEGDVSFIAHVSYDIEQIGPFLATMERIAPRRVAALFERQPTWSADSLWQAIHGEARDTLPSLPEFLVLLIARGVLPDVVMIDAQVQSYDSIERALDFARRQTWVRPGSDTALSNAPSETA